MLPAMLVLLKPYSIKSGKSKRPLPLASLLPKLQISSQLSSTLIDMQPVRILMKLITSFKSVQSGYLGSCILGVTLLILSKEPRRLNYDLQVLCDHIQNNSIERVVIYFEDSECFQEALLTDLIDVLTYGHTI